MDQRNCVKFCVKILTVDYGIWRVYYDQVQLWYNRLKESGEDVNVDDRPDRLNTSATYENIEAVKKMFSDNCRITIREVADIGILFGSCQAIFKSVLGMKRTAAKIVPKPLNFEQSQSH